MSWKIGPILIIALLSICIPPDRAEFLEGDSSSEEEIEDEEEEQDSRYPWRRRAEDANAIIPTVNTHVGTFLGLKELSRSGTIFYILKGIPYAEPPKRFQAAKPKRPMEEPYDSRYARSQCPQLPETNDFKDSGSEDCLSLQANFHVVTSKGTESKM